MTNKTEYLFRKLSLKDDLYARQNKFLLYVVFPTFQAKIWYFKARSEKGKAELIFRALGLCGCKYNNKTLNQKKKKMKMK